MPNFLAKLRLATAILLLFFACSTFLSAQVQQNNSDFHYPARGAQHYLSVSHIIYPAEDVLARNGFSGVVNCHATYPLHPAGVLRALVGFGLYQFKYVSERFGAVSRIGGRPQAMLLVQPRLGRRANLQLGAGYGYYVKLSGGHDFQNNQGMYTARAGLQLAALSLAVTYQTDRFGRSGGRYSGSTGKLLELSLGCAF